MRQTLMAAVLAVLLIQCQAYACHSELSIIKEVDEHPPQKSAPTVSCCVNVARIYAHKNWTMILNQIHSIPIPKDDPRHIGALLLDIDCTLIREVMLFPNPYYLHPQSYRLIQDTILNVLNTHFKLKGRSLQNTSLFELYANYKKDSHILFDAYAFKLKPQKREFHNSVTKNLKSKIKVLEDKLHHLSSTLKKRGTRQKEHLYAQLLELQMDEKKHFKRQNKIKPEQFYIPYWVLMDEDLPEHLRALTQNGWHLFGYTSRLARWSEVASRHLKYLGIDLQALNRTPAPQNHRFEKFDLPHPLSMMHHKRIIFANGLKKGPAYAYVVKFLNDHLPEMEKLTSVHVDDTHANFLTPYQENRDFEHHKQIDMEHTQILISPDCLKSYAIKDMLAADMVRFDFIHKFRNYLLFCGIEFEDLATD